MNETTTTFELLVRYLTRLCTQLGTPFPATAGVRVVRLVTSGTPSFDLVIYHDGSVNVDTTCPTQAPVLTITVPSEDWSGLLLKGEGLNPEHVTVTGDFALAVSLSSLLRIPTA